MDGGYRLLKIRQERDAMIAALPLSKVFGKDLREAYRQDCQRLVQHATCSIVFDLRQVEFIDDSFFTRVLEVWRGLKERSIGLRVQLSPGLAEVARITKLDRLLGIDVAENQIQP